MVCDLTARVTLKAPSFAKKDKIGWMRYKEMKCESNEHSVAKEHGTCVRAHTPTLTD